MITIENEGDVRAAVIAAAIPPGVAPNIATSYAVLTEQAKSTNIIKEYKIEENMITIKVGCK